jgi:hypothetical protein
MRNSHRRDGCAHSISNREQWGEKAPDAEADQARSRTREDRAGKDGNKEEDATILAPGVIIERMVGRSNWLRRLKILSVGLHLLFVISAPFGHHDLVCHLKQPLHCTSCVASPLSSSPKAVHVVGAWTLTEAGRAIETLPSHKGIVLAVRSTGRSPPAVS